MDWVNTHRTTLEQPAIAGATADEFHTWFWLNAYCHFQENGGRIAGARKWRKDTWLVSVKIGRDQVTRKCPLWKWEGDDLVVAFYPVDKEQAAQAMRRGHKKGGRIRWQNLAQPYGQAHGRADAQAQAQPYGQAHGRADAQACSPPVSPLSPPLISPPIPHSDPPSEVEEEEKDRRSSASDVSLLIPDRDDVRAWAKVHEIDPDYAENLWNRATEEHRWIVNGQLIEWRRRWLRFWEADREGWWKNKKNAAAEKRGGGRASFQKPDDAECWWMDDEESIRGLLCGLSQADDKTQFNRLREIVEFRKRNKLFL